MNHDHANHPHQHGPNCGHTGVVHNGHVDYLHDGHLHHVEGKQVSEHAVPVSAKNPDGCTVEAPAKGHASDHKHGANCGHAQIPHGDHVDYLVDGELHHAHDGHCDDHGKIDLA